MVGGFLLASIVAFALLIIIRRCKAIAIFEIEMQFGLLDDNKQREMQNLFAKSKRMNQSYGWPFLWSAIMMWFITIVAALFTRSFDVNGLVFLLAMVLYIISVFFFECLLCPLRNRIRLEMACWRAAHPAENDILDEINRQVMLFDELPEVELTKIAR